MSEWVRVDPDAIAASEEHPEQGITIHVSVAALDIPEAVRGFYDEAKKRFVIELRYAVDEPTRRIEDHDLFVLLVGKRSDRLFGMEIDVDGIGANKVKLEVRQLVEKLRTAIERIPERPGQANIQGHKRAAERVIEQVGPQFAQELLRRAA